ncbi:MAG: ComEA family DNA-binding protein [Candidatus Omnitrophota bacterium]
MFWFTTQEKKVLLFILSCLSLGILASYYFKLHPPIRKVPHVENEKTLIQVKKVNINSANFSELVSIPGIGPVLAESILEYRKKEGPFRNLDQLKNVKGIGEKKLKAIAEYILLE